MSVRASTIIRVAALAGLSFVAALAFIRPFQDEPKRAAPSPVPNTTPPTPTRRTPEGLIAVDAAALLTQVRRTAAEGVVVNAWASWCGSCKGDMPMLLGLKKPFGTKIAVLFVSVDEPETQADAADMLRALGAPPPNYVVDEPLDTFKAAMSPHWPGMLPATFLFDRTGKLRYFWGGPVLENEITALLSRYLAGEHIDGEANFALAPGAVTR